MISNYFSKHRRSGVSDLAPQNRSRLAVAASLVQEAESLEETGLVNLNLLLVLIPTMQRKSRRQQHHRNLICHINGLIVEINSFGLRSDSVWASMGKYQFA